MPNELSEKVYPDGTVVKLRDDAAREQIATISSLLGGKADRFVSSVNSTTQTIDIGVPAEVANRMYLLSAGYLESNNHCVFGLITISSSNIIKYISLIDTLNTVTVTYTNGIISLTFLEHPYSKAVLIRLS